MLKQYWVIKMGKYLLIVESPAKAKTIEKYLGKGYVVKSSVGHVRDLSKSGPGRLGIDIENNFSPKYTVKKDKKEIVKELKEFIKKNKIDIVYLATDPDREGEAISWHLYEVLDLAKKESIEVKRVVFNEITESAVVNAIKNPRDIDYDLVKSQESRRMLDRIIGFKLSGLIKSKLQSRSAGRVQSVALKIIVEREREIEKFIPEEYWKIKSTFNKEDQIFVGELEKYQDDKLKITNEDQVNKIFSELSDEYKIESISKREREKKPKPPFITSTLQQEAATKLNYTSKKTMMVAQKLYEGIKVETGLTGLITYMRTDSIRLSSNFIGSAKAYIENEFGNDMFRVNIKTPKNKNIQDAHEAIRPTDVNLTPLDVKKYLTNDQFKLYKLIWVRTVASLMKSAVVAQKSIVINNNDYKFKVTGQEIIDKGYLKIYSEYEVFKNEILPNLNDGEVLVCDKVEKSQHFTQPPARFSEAKLIKTLEELGIGRPSTYASILDTIKTRGYVNVEEKRFKPTSQGVLTSDKLEEFFNSIINVEYTANMETVLDKIAKGEIVWHDELAKFYNHFMPLLEYAKEHMETIGPRETGEMCPECGAPLVIRLGRFGEFVACSAYPECTYIKKNKDNQEPPKKIGIKCPVCNEGDIVERVAKRGRTKGKVFYACSSFPKCNNAYANKPIEEKCPKCGKLLMDSKKGIICSDTKNCDFKKDS